MWRVVDVATDWSTEAAHKIDTQTDRVFLLADPPFREALWLLAPYQWPVSERVSAQGEFSWAWSWINSRISYDVGAGIEECHPVFLSLGKYVGERTTNNGDLFPQLYFPELFEFKPAILNKETKKPDILFHVYPRYCWTCTNNSFPIY